MCCITFIFFQFTIIIILIPLIGPHVLVSFTLTKSLKKDSFTFKVWIYCFWFLTRDFQDTIHTSHILSKAWVGGLEWVEHSSWSRRFKSINWGWHKKSGDQQQLNFYNKNAPWQLLFVGCLLALHFLSSFLLLNRVINTQRRWRRDGMRKNQQRR